MLNNKRKCVIHEINADKNLKSLETIINCELFKVVGWLIANKLSLNIKKTNYIIF